MHNRYLIALILLCAPCAAVAQEPPPATHPAASPTPRAPLQVEIELSAVEVSFPPGKSPLESQPLAYADIEKFPAKSVKLLDRVLVSGKSGERSVAKHLLNAATPDSKAKQTSDAPTFASGESGTIVQLVPVVGPGAVVCDVNISYQFRNTAGASAEKKPRDIDFTTSFTAKPGSPLIINVSSEPGRENTFTAIVARVHLVDFKPSKTESDGKSPANAVSSPKK